MGMLGFPQGSLGELWGRGAIGGLLVVCWGSVGGLLGGGQGSVRCPLGVHQGLSGVQWGSDRDSSVECLLGICTRYVWGYDRWVSQ